MLQELRSKHPESYGFTEAELLVNLLLDNQQPDEAYNVAEDWQAHHDDMAQAARLVNILHFHGQPSLASKLLEPYTAQQLADNLPLLQEKILLEMESGDRQAAYEALKQLNAEHRLTPELAERFLFLSLARDERDMAARLMDAVDFSSLSEPQLLSLLELALARQYPPLVARIVDAAHQQDAAHFPLLSTILTLVEHKPEAGARLTALEGQKLNPSQALMMARLCLRYGRNDDVRRFLALLPEQLSDAEIASVADIDLQLGDLANGEAALNRAAHPDMPELAAIRLRYQATRGDFAGLSGWLDANGQTAEIPLLTDLYFIALNHRQLLLAARISETLYAREPNDLTRSYVVQATMRAGNYAKAASLLRQVPKRSPADEANYFTALTHLAANDTGARRELAAYAAARLHSGASESEKTGLVYALVNTHQAALAMPEIHALALRQGGQWAFLYAKLLDDAGRHQEARDFWMKVALSPASTPNQRRDIAYALLNQGDRDDAESLLVTLANRAPAESPVVRQLLYVWGPRLSGAHAQWLTDRYMAASGVDKAHWANYVGDYVSGEALTGLVADHPESLNEPRIAQSYFTYLASGGELPEVGADIEALSADQQNPEILRSYGEIAMANGMRRPARQAFDQLFARNGADTDALRQAGVLAYNGADFTAARLYLDEYMESGMAENDPQAGRALFLYGDLLRRDERAEEALPYYRAAYARFQAEGLDTPESHINECTINCMDGTAGRRAKRACLRNGALSQ